MSPEPDAAKSPQRPAPKNGDDRARRSEQRGDTPGGDSKRSNNRRGNRTKDNNGRGRRNDQRQRPQRVSQKELDAAAAKRAAVTLEPIVFPPELPVSARREDIAAAIRDHQVVIVAGETGSGKTTQIPKIALAMGRGRTGQIGHTQPRRIAARSVAERIAEELGTELGNVVGYQVRFTDQSSEQTLVKVMTDGILLAQIQRDPELLAYDTLIIDEAHERSLNIDFLLGYLTNLLPRRPDLKIIITSATIDSTRFARHFASGGPLPPLEEEPQADDAASQSTTPSPTPTVPADERAAPVIEVTGRTYPVEVLYRPLEGESKGQEKDLITGIVDACDELSTWGNGDILVFLSGEREIRDAADALEGHYGPRARDPRHPQRIEILPLYSRLSAADQHKVFSSHTGRRIVLATNVAETSLTVPGIHYVVDPGTARISRYSKATKVQRLPIEPISQASANQRSGRAGRLADGIAIRLYSREDFDTRPPFTEPEILRTSLASVLLHMISVGVVSSPAEVADFPFVESPETSAIRDGVQLLEELGAVTAGKGVHARTVLTDVGRKLARLPIDPRHARMIVEGARRDVARDVTVIAAALSIQDPRERPTEQREKADRAHARFADPASDLLSYLNLWEYCRERQQELSGSAFRRMCKAEHLNFLRIREWQDLVAQIRQQARPLGIDIHHRAPTPVVDDPKAADASAGTSGGKNTQGEDAPGSIRHVWNDEAIHRSVLAGLLSHIGMQETAAPKASSFAHLKGSAREAAVRRAKKQGRNDYIGARGARFAIFPGSGLAKKPPAFIMAAELVETSRLWARDAARIQPEWAEELAGPLAKKTHSEPHWSTKRGAALAREKVLLYGVPIVTDRTVLWAQVDPEAARDMFVTHALVQGEWTTHHSFWNDNQRVLAEAADLEARSRTRGLVIDDEAIFAFYDERIPAEVVSAAHFDKWWKDARRENPDLLSFSLSQLAPEAGEADPNEFPSDWPQGELTLPLTYQFEPGTEADGVTVHLPLEVLPQVVADGFDWMVPGLLDELTTATIRALPKAIRRLLVPAPDTAREVLGWLDAHTPEWADIVRAGDMANSFQSEFGRAVRDIRGVDIPDEAWDEATERLPAHLRMTFRVEERITEPGRGGRTRTRVEVVGESSDLLSLQRHLADRARAAVQSAVQSTRTGTGSPSPTRTPTPHPMPGLRNEDSGTPPRAPAAGAASGAGAAEPSSATSNPTSSDAKEVASLPRSIDEQAHLSTWPAGLPQGALPSEVATQVGALVVRGYPGIVEEGAAPSLTAALRVLADRSRRDAAHARGVRRLLTEEAALGTKRITSRWTGTESLTLAASPYRSTEALVADLQFAAVWALTTPDAGAAAASAGGFDAAAVRDAETYAKALAHVRAHLEDEVYALVGRIVPALAAGRDIDVAVANTSSLAMLPILADVRDHKAELLTEGFLARVAPHRIRHLARYLRADVHRLDKAPSDPNRDAERLWQLRGVADEVAAARAEYEVGRSDQEREQQLEQARWMLEELRVSLFAQQLGTDGPVSDKRIRKMLHG
ncbi:ATP-dependent RNA helicase HrpA [Demequina aurantiaca]|uniref:ATP-dependent RNA helicase HrpA n=1 Tax=Demequina aurantiaca TaxID=676200 RepID=UPI0009FEA025|nr:ATP-dependent RNA helicase HrpA [Demequina aurantiaca]